MFAKKSLIAAAALVAFAGIATTAAAAVANAQFNVQMTVNKTCTVTAGAASNITLGSTLANGTSASSSNTFKVNCSKNTPFFIGLAPQYVASTTGLGTMKGTGSNTDTVQYQLYSNAAMGSANVWGNTATATSVGNGVSGSGAGMGTAVTETVWANVTGSTDVTPDTYSDTVAINVNF